MDLGIKGKSAIVTGGSRGIGRETARQFLEEGVRVTICGRNAETLERTRAELAKQTGGEIHAVVADTMKQDGHRAPGRKRETALRHRRHPRQQRRARCIRAVSPC